MEAVLFFLAEGFNFKLLFLNTKKLLLRNKNDNNKTATDKKNLPEDIK